MLFTSLPATGMLDGEQASRDRDPSLECGVRPTRMRGNRDTDEGTADSSELPSLLSDIIREAS